MVPNSKKIRVITNRVDFITTAKAIRSGVGMSSEFNSAMMRMLRDLDNMYTPKGSCRGLVQSVEGFSIQVTVL